MLALVSLEDRVPSDHPLRRMKPLVQQVLTELDPVFDAMYAAGGRPSVPPERLLKALLLMALYSIRSDRQFAEQLEYNLLYRWFLDLDLTEHAFDASTFSKNRQRLLDYDVPRRFFDGVVALADGLGLLSTEHYSVDGTLIEAWGSTKSFRPKDEDPATVDANGFADFKGTKRTNDTHASVTDPDARMYKKGRGKEAKLSHMAHVLIENRHGLVVDYEVTEALGTAERTAALTMVDRERERQAKKRKRKASKASKRKNRKGRRMTLAADKGYDTRDFVRGCRERHVTPHVAQNQHARRSSAIDRRTTRHPGYRLSATRRRLSEQPFGWTKAWGGFRRSRFRGRPRTEAAGLVTTAAYNLVRIAKLTAAA